ncbi:MAG: helix-turn-helix domain-containing protein [Lachnospiraceae bacterium]|nr:helix-turn-helix domain-containing protein [Lachnospiraceae bacterium]
MEKKTMGSFIAALRKANGLTQQDIADRLNVSNKAVSRWERDECMPDIMLIPALAELLGVTCDELLRGEKKKPESFSAPTAAPDPDGEENETEGEHESEPAPVKEKPDPRIAKQVRAVVKRELSFFKLMIAISVGCSLVGCLLLFGFTYGLYRKIIGFTATSVFAVAAFLLAAIAVGRAREAKEDNELFDSAPQNLRDRYDRTLGNFSLTAFALAAGAVLISLPQIFVPYYYKTIMGAENYFPLAFLIALAVAAVTLAVRAPYVGWVTGNKAVSAFERAEAKDLAILDLTQLGTLTPGLWLILYSSKLEGFAWWIAWLPGMLLMFAAPALFFFLLYPKMKRRGSDVLVQGIRNIALLVPAVTLNVGSYVVSDYQTKEVYLDEKSMILALWLFAAIFLVAAVISLIRKSKKQN